MVGLEEFIESRDNLTCDHFVGVDLQKIENEYAIMIEIISQEISHASIVLFVRDGKGIRSSCRERRYWRRGG